MIFGQEEVENSVVSAYLRRLADEVDAGRWHKMQMTQANYLQDVAVGLHHEPVKVGEILTLILMAGRKGGNL